MFNMKQYRAKSAEYGALSKGSTDPGQVRQYQDSSDSFGSLAENEEWLADNFDKTLQPSDEKHSIHTAIDAALAVKEEDTILAVEEEHVLRCLGASVIMQWNTIPTKLQRELFDTAGSMGELLATAELRGQIARFLQKHKDDVAGRHVEQSSVVRPDAQPSAVGITGSSK
jgi:hypothetical protein